MKRMGKVWMSPKYSPTNKYNDLFSTCIENEGYVVDDFNKSDFFSLKSNDILHIHWFHPYYQSRIRLIFLIKSLIVIICLTYLRLKNVRVVWTFHNLYPHNYKFKHLEKWVRRKILRSCSVVTVAAESIKESLIKEFGIDEGKVHLVHHGHYKGKYPQQNIDYRKKYNISNDKFIYLFVGAIKPYKGVDLLVEEFLKLEQENVHLIIAGKVYNGMEGIIEDLRGIQNITFDLRFIPDEEIVDLIESSDIVVLPYKNITTSGTAILACSLHKPIICPETPFMMEYFNEHIAYLYNNQSSTGFLMTMKKAFRDKDNYINNTSYFVEFTNKLEWDLIGKKMKSLYNNIYMKSIK
ncbi:glycosyltransferase [Peribacillus frigoritolerans]|uniref:glycosyltransferase n=1 Tax=Peribacillus frigoritolerans TaxID=450367 RepID=UPI0021A30E2D|nr:glycosyltransferase [Peribacillus frigoritolerans]MCT1391447.1 glycosyltransferase [Peribacillus frigoritolerans]